MFGSLRNPYFKRRIFSFNFTYVFNGLLLFFDAEWFFYKGSLKYALHNYLTVSFLWDSAPFVGELSFILLYFLLGVSLRVLLSIERSVFIFIVVGALLLTDKCTFCYSVLALFLIFSFEKAFLSFFSSLFLSYPSFSRRLLSDFLSVFLVI